MNKEIARVTSWNDCIVIGCRLENGHEGPHDFSVPVSKPWTAAPVVDLSALPAGPAAAAEEAAVLAQPFAVSTRPPAGAPGAYQPKHLERWTLPPYYMGAEWPDYFVFLGRTRDSRLTPNNPKGGI